MGSLLAHAALGATGDYLKKSDDWFESSEAAKIAENILSWQAETGGWPKNEDVATAPYSGDRAALRATFDNSATTDELRFLARMFEATDQPRYQKAFERGYDHILEAQYPTGGWPQFYPPSTQYHRHITFNDNSMVRLMEFLRETYTQERYEFISKQKRQAAHEAFDAGIACILKCQIRVDGKLTAWCAQHDEKNYDPRPARSYELTSLSGSESVGIIRLLMSLDDPKDEVIEAVDAAVTWFESVKLEGVRLEEKDDDIVLVKDDNAPPLWARFYEIGTNRPIYCDRDGIKKYRLDEIGSERRNGYSWLGDWPARLLEKEYPAWKEKLD